MLMLLIVFCVFSHLHITDEVPFNPTTGSLVPVPTTSLKISISRKIRESYTLLSNNAKSTSRIRKDLHSKQLHDCVCASFFPDSFRVVNGEKSTSAIRVEKGMIAELRCTDPEMNLVWQHIALTSKSINLTCNDCRRYTREEIPLCQGSQQEPVILCEKFSDESTKLLHVEYEDASLPAGSRATFSCRRNNQTLIGERISECRGNANWTSPPPQCSDLCTAIDVSESFDVLYTNGRSINSKAYFYCKDINLQIQGNRVKICLPTGQWSDANPTCKDPVIRCTRFSDEDLNLLNVQYDDKDIRAGTMAHFSCKDKDQRLIGKNTSVCLRNVKWSSEPPQCKAISCENPEHPENGQVIFTSLTFRSQLQFKCDDGYLLNSEGTVFCASNGTWSRSDVRCIAISCNHPEHPDNGQVTYTSVTFRSQLKFKCDDGYLLNTEEPVNCTSNGTWSRNDVRCIAISCDRPEHPEDGQVTYSSLKFRSRLRFKCDDGYLLTPNEPVFCTSNGTWSTTDVKCVAKTCYRPDHPQNGQVIFTSLAFSSELKFKCDEGYLLKPNEPVFCTSDGTWSRTDVQCVAKTCDRPEHPENGQVIYTSLTFRSELKFKCDDGYLLKPNEPVFCTSNGTWSRTDVQCVAKTCDRPEHPENGQAIFTSVTFRSELKFKCDDGYLLKPNEPVFCTSNGTWSKTDVQCIAKTCDLPEHPENGQVIFTFLTFRSTLKFKCDEGYLLKPNEPVVCTSEGTWSRTDVRCVVKTCNRPDHPENGQVTFTSLSFGSQLSLKCNEGYRLQANGPVYCTSDGNWNSTNVQCVEINCFPPANPENGRVRYTSLRYGSKLKYECDKGFVISQHGQRKCIQNGTWSNNDPVCNEVLCTRPANPENGRVRYSSLKYGSELQYVCDKGFVLSQHQQRKCNQDGTWSNSAPVCNEVQCNPPTNPKNGRVIYSSLRYGSELRYECDKGFQISQNGQRTCTEDGTWSNTDPVCNEVQCVRPVTPENGRVRYSSLRYGSELRYECDMGFVLSQHTRRKCTQDGTWSNSAPVCKEITCEMPLSPEYGTVQVSGKPTVDSTASYSCEDGRKIVGSSVSKCLINGLWEYPPPKCVNDKCEVPLSPEYGTVQLSRYPPKESSTATYKCEDGWIMDGAVTSKCLIKGRWSHPPPKCIRGTCDMPLSPEYGTVQLSSYPPKVNTTATYSCENGRTMIGEPVSKCLIGGRWRYSTPRCRS